MPTKVNVVLDDDVKAELDRMVESGLRSRVINRALRRELSRLHRDRVSKKIDQLRAKTRKVATADLVKALRADRSR